MDWGSAADWVAALGTTGALAASLFLIRSDRHARVVDELERLDVRLSARPGRTADDEIELRIRNRGRYSLHDLTAHIYFRSCDPRTGTAEWVGLTFRTAELSRGRELTWGLGEVTRAIYTDDHAFVVARFRLRGSVWVARRGMAPVQLKVRNRRKLAREFGSCSATVESADRYRLLDWRMASISDVPA